MKVKLPEEVAGKYMLVNWKGSDRQYFGKKFGIVDLKTLTVRHADRLFSRGFSKLKLRPVSTSKKEGKQS